MDTSDLRALLHRLRDGHADDAGRARARAALVEAWGPEAGDLSLDPDEIGSVLAILDEAEDALTSTLRGALGDDLPEADVAAAVMATLALPELGVGAAVAHEAGRPPELASGLDPDAAPVAEAVADEAGPAPDVGLRFAERSWPIEAALAREAGLGPEVGRGFDPGALPIAEAVADEAGGVDLADTVLARLTDPDGLPEAWLSALLDRALPTGQHVAAAERAARDPRARAQLAAWADVGRQVREGVLADAGPAPSLWREVAAAVGLDDPERVEGWDEQLLRAAIPELAGTVDVADAVMAVVRKDAIAPLADLPEPANRGAWAQVGVLVAMAALILLALGLRFGLQGTPDPEFRQLDPVTFASVEEVQLDQAHYGENQSVFVEPPLDDGAPVVIWVDDGGQL